MRKRGVREEGGEGDCGVTKHCCVKALLVPVGAWWMQMHVS